MMPRRKPAPVNLAPGLGSVIGVLALLVLLPACRSKVFRHSGAVNVGGEMKVSGKFDVDDLGELATAIRLQDSHSKPLRAIRVGPPKPASLHTSKKIAVIDVDGLLVDRVMGGGLAASGENPVALFREKLDQVRSDRSIGAVVLRLNSPGGGVTASDMMCHELMRLKQERQLPIIASLGVVGAGGAYYLANHCDAIVAQPTSVVGGIGVILNTYNLEDTMGQFNILGVPIKSGEQIDAGSPQRPLEDNELEMLQGIADSFHQRLIDQVTSTRPQLLVSGDRWKEGQVMTGQQAADLGLVDTVGYLDTAITLAEGQVGAQESLDVVLYRREDQQAYTPLDSTPNAARMQSLLPIHVPGLSRSEMPTFLYMWQPDPQMAN
ncbi:MAG: S49 family peptidase [Planctomycetota bacterium]